MNAQEKWNYIVTRQRACFSQSENVVQREWEEFFSEFFEYKKLYGELIPQPRVQVGTREVKPDIVLKKDGCKVVDIELKQYSMQLNSAFETQMKSYLMLEGISIGVLVCNKIYLYWFTYPSTLTKIEIPFVENNERGISFVELLNKNNFDVDKINKFIFSEKEKENSVYDINKKLNEDFIKECVIEKLTSLYSKDVVANALADITFCVKNTTRQNAITNIQNKNVDNNISRQISGDFPETHDFIIIKTSEDRVRVCNGSLYDATRHAWHVSYDSVIRYPYVLAVINGYVKEVYRVKNWYPAKQWDSDFKDSSIRYEFVGEVASEAIRNKWLEKLIPEHYRKKGMASPVVYSKLIEG